MQTFNEGKTKHISVGGIAARASDINTETAYALHLFNTPKPLPIEELLVSMPHAGVCLVDHQQVSQLNKAIDVRNTH
jgi:manganese-dependent inorganic pyrophosphatase